MQTFLRLFFVSLIVLLSTDSILAQPNSITLRGRIVDNNGDPLTGTRLFRLRFFDGPTAGTQLGSDFSSSTTLSSNGLFEIPVSDSVFGSFIDSPAIYYELAIDSAASPDGSIDPGDVFPQRVEITSVLFAQTVVNQGDGSGLDADLLDGRDSESFADSDHTHEADDISGTFGDGQIPSLIARDAEVFGLVLSADGPGSGLNSDLLDDMDSSDFAPSTHTHISSEISGVFDASQIDGDIARDTEVFGLVLNGDGSGSNLDADLLDGLDSIDFAASDHGHDFSDISGTVPERQIDDDITRDNEVFGNVTSKDGSGSGLDADLLDGMDSTEFVTQAELMSALSNLIEAPDPPSAPTELRMIPSPLGPNYRRFEWNMDSMGGLENFVLYEYDQQSPLKGSLNTSGAKSYQTTTTFVDVPIITSFSEKTFQVAAINFLGESSPLSDPYILNTIYWYAVVADEEIEDKDELYISIPRSDINLIKVSGNGAQKDTRVENPVFAPDSRSILFSADINVDGQYELWLTDISLSSLNKSKIDPRKASSWKGLQTLSPTQLNFPPIPGRDIEDYAYSPTAREVVFISDSADLGDDQLFVSYIDGTISTNLLSSTNPRYDVSQFRFTPDGKSVIYLAETDDGNSKDSNSKGIPSNIEELFIVPLDGSEDPEKLSVSLPGVDLTIRDFAISPNGNYLAFRYAERGSSNEVLYSSLYSIPSQSTEKGSVGMFDDFRESYRFTRNGDLIWGTTDDNLLLSFQSVYKLYNPLFSNQNWDVEDDFLLTYNGNKVIWRGDFNTTFKDELFINSTSVENFPIRLSQDTLGSSGDVFDFKLSPDNTKVIFTADFVEDNARELYVNDLTGLNDPLRISGTPTTAGSGIEDREFYYMPDGEFIMCIADLDTADLFSVYQTNDTGVNGTLLIYEPTSSVDGDAMELAVPTWGWDIIEDGKRNFDL